MKQLCKKSALVGVCALLFLNSIFFTVSASEKLEPYYYSSQNNSQDAVFIEQPITLLPKDATVSSESGTVLSVSDSNGYNNDTIKVNPKGKIEYTVDVPKTGAYYIGLDYFIPKKEMSELILSVQINGEYQFYDSRNIVLESVWKDELPEYIKDDFGNDLFPAPDRVYRWQSKQFNSTIYNFSYPYLFNLNEGKNTITLTSNEIEFILGDLTISGQAELLNYDGYKQTIPDEAKVDAEPIVLEGEKYTEKTKSYIRGSKGNDHTQYPYDASKNLINSLSAGMWAMPNEGVSYKFNIEKTGVYYVTFKYWQGKKRDMPSFKQIQVDGEYLFDELRNYPFPYTKKGDQNETLNIDGDNIPIYFEAGEHEISLTSTAQPVYETYENLLKVINRCNEIALEIKVITGNKADKNRDWEIDEYIPTLSEELIECANTVTAEYDKLIGMASKKNIAVISNLKVAAVRLVDFSNDLNSLVNNLDQFTQSSSSVTEYISLVLPELLGQPLGVDQITISTDVNDVASAKKGFFYSLWENIKKFFLSFIVQSSDLGNIKEDDLNVWVNRSVAHLDVMKEMATSFEMEKGVKVNMSLMPDEQKLLLAVSSGNAPDAVIGMSNYRPFDFAMRGAMYDLREFDNFSESIQSYNPDMLIPFIVDDSCYALPETANFQVMFYRKDIMDTLGLEIPQTWDDVIEILPTLSRYGMDFNTMIANVGGTKHFGATVPFIQQYEGKIYSDDGTKVELGDPNTVEAFKLMTDLYTKYSLPENVPNFYNNFKKGITPIGMGDINTYILLQNAAPEIAGQWGIAPSVGVMNDNGEINRYQASVASANGIMRDANDPQMAWDFITWYMSDDVQIDFANQLQLRYGPEYIWNTANINALSKSVAFAPDDKKIIMEQLDQTMEIPRNPAYFAVERELSNAWNSTVFDGVSPRTALDQAITRSNREITKKLKEFSYLDSNGNVIKEFKMATRETVEQWMKE